MSMSTDKKQFFNSKIGLVAATLGSAVGLGTIWRFPAEAQAGGGGAFLLIYILCVLVLGIPVMLGEFAIGRAGRSDAVGSFRRLSPGRPWWMFGGLAVVASYLIMAFYMVVAGWTLEYLWQSISGGLFEGLGQSANDVGVMDNQFAQRMSQYVEQPWAPLIATWAVIAINIIILLGGVQKGIERMSNIAMPLLFVLLLGFVCVSLSLPGAGQGVDFFLNPDFTKVTPGVFIDALGQALFSLSLAMGILITYASYYPPTTNLVKTSVVVVAMTIVIAVMMGLLIFPAVTSFGLTDHGLSGTTLVFVTLPEVFMNLPVPQLWAILFFGLLFLAAMTSTVSIAEVSIAFVRDRFKVRRPTAVLTVLLPLVVLSAVCSLSFSTLSEIKIGGRIIFDFLDSATNNYMLPAVAMGTCLYLGWGAPHNLLKDQLTNDGTLSSWAVRPVRFALRYIAPAAILAIFVWNML